MSQALEGVRVVELSHFLSAPRCAALLAEQGADVVKIEPPHGEQLRVLMSLMGTERQFSAINAGKRGVSVDLKTTEGQNLVRELIQAADVVVENFTPGIMDGLGLGYRQMREQNPGLIYAAISGFGQDGEHGQRGAFDIIAQATSGVMDGLDRREQPPGVFFADLVTGGYAAMAISMALFARERTGEGAFIDVAMQDVMYAHHFSAHCIRALGDASSIIPGLGQSFVDLLGNHERPLPFWNSYPTSDGHVAVVALSDGQWSRLVDALDIDELRDAALYGHMFGRVNNAARAVELIRGWTEDRRVDDVIDVLSAARVPVGQVRNTDEVNSDPHLVDRGILSNVHHERLGDIDVPGPVFSLGDRVSPRTAHPDLGEHNQEVLAEWLSLPEGLIEELRHKKVI